MKKRFEEIDFARVIPLLFLPIVHCYEMFSNYGFITKETINSGKIFLYLCALGPSVFMIILGMNIVFSSHNSPKQLIKRGIITILIFYAHNVIRYLIPASIFTLATKQNYLSEAIRGFFISDILFFAGITFIFFGLMKKWNVKPFKILMISLLLLTIHTIIMPEDMPATVLTVIVGNFVHVTHHSAFAAMSWLIFPAIGYYFGYKMIEYSKENKLIELYRNLLLGSVMTLFAICVCLKSYNLNYLLIGASAANDYITNLFNVIIDTSIAFIWIVLSNKIYYSLKRKFSSKFSNFILKTSKSILPFYLIQWIFVTIAMFILAVLGYNETYKLGFEIVLFSSVIILALTIYLAPKLQKKITNIQLKHN